MWFWLVTVSAREYQLGFPTGRDSATFRDKGTEVPSLSRDKGTMGQAQNLTKGLDGPGKHVKIRDRTCDRTVRDFDRQRDRADKDVL